MHRDLFPEIMPYETGTLPLSHGHEMYWEQSGNPEGQPILFLHGGPGAGTNSNNRRFYDPEFYRIILFDQRGCGKSTPNASVDNNTTQHLIADIELLREFLGIEKWFVFGGSWGSTLALAYAQSFNNRCRGLILRGIFLCAKEEVDWFIYGMGRFFPEAWQEFSNAIPESKRTDLLTAYLNLLENPDPDINLPAARAWVSYEANCSSLQIKQNIFLDSNNTENILALARLEAYYLANNGFLKENYLINNIDSIRHLPGVIVQGRYDMVCPPTTAYCLASVWPEARIEIIADAGHSALEPGIRRALVKATEMMKKIK